ncbi:hypothetical protein WMF27_37355 [Sorangium sp. So ce281]|uniref:LIC_13387 family protein n=1 Tax=Sorangium sp. So ce281 TaxID=3133293 RepID=UPI003F62BBFF
MHVDLLARRCAGRVAHRAVASSGGHLAITALLLGRPAPPAAETAVLGAMRAHRMTMMGLSRDLLGLFRGFSVAMGLVLALHGAVCVLAAPALVALPAVVALNAAVSLALLAIAVRAFPPPPIVTMLVLTLRLIDGVARRLVDGHHELARARSRRAMAITRLRGPRRWAMAISGARGRSTRDGHRVG